MKKNDLFRCKNDIFRVLEVSQNDIFVINCTRQTMPQWCDLTEISDNMLDLLDKLAMFYDIRQDSSMNKIMQTNYVNSLVFKFMFYDKLR